MIANLSDLDSFVEREVIESFDQRYLNEEVPDFRNKVPTTENVCREIYLAAQAVSPAYCVERVRIEETSKKQL